MSEPCYPALYEMNTRVWLYELSCETGRPMTLREVPDAELDRLASFGMDWIWLLGVWQTGTLSREVSRTNSAWHHEFRNILPDLTEGDICGSPFAVQDYKVHADFGGNEAPVTSEPGFSNAD